MKSLKIKQLLKFGLIALLVLGIQNSIFAQNLTKEIMKSNSVEIKEDIFKLLSSGNWKVAYTGRKRKDKVRRIKKPKDLIIWKFNPKNEKTIAIKTTFLDINKTWSNNCELITYSNQNTFAIKTNGIFTPYEIVKTNEKFIIIQELDVYKFNLKTGVVFTEGELKKRREESEERLFGGRNINIGGRPSFKRIVLIKEK